MGSTDALFQQGMALQDGFGVAQDETAAAGIFCQMTTTLGRYHCARMAIAGKARGLDKAAGLALLEALVKEGDRESIRLLAYYNLNGIGIRKNIPEGRRLVELDVAQGDATAMAWKGEMLEKGIGYERSLAEAVRWYERAAEQDQSDALLALGRIYEKGLRGKADPDSALRFYRRALQAGKAEAGAGVSRLSRRPDASTVLDVLPPQ